MNAQKVHELKCDDVGKEVDKSEFTYSGMGTRVEYSINLLSATSVESNNKLSVKGVDVWENHHQNKDLISSENPHRFGIGTNYYLQFPMERRMLDRNIVESIKRTMQMHEEIFKHQVSSFINIFSYILRLNHNAFTKITS